jgi:gamma-glutamylcyclotransferase (GGCT)/AIG2-like uncharacterized protein YtfP
MTVTTTNADLGTPAADFAAHPYPGARPDYSFVQINGRVHAVEPDEAAPSGWRMRADGSDLDAWLTGCGEVAMTGRIPVLAYGSNACPSKLVDLASRRTPFSGAAVVLRCETRGLAAAWCAGTRADRAVPATLVASEGTENHAVMFCTEQQMPALDLCEGRPRVYALVRLGHGQVVLEDGSHVRRCLAYVGAGHNRVALADGEDRPLLVASASQAEAAHALTSGAVRWSQGVSAGLDAEEVRTGHPRPEEWLNELFVYGTLQPGQRLWQELAPYVDEVWPQPGLLDGTMFDTGYGYPAATRQSGPGIPGTVVRLKPALLPQALAQLDHLEGVEVGLYRRARVRLSDGTRCWTYLYARPVTGMAVLHDGWRGRVPRQTQPGLLA